VYLICLSVQECTIIYVCECTFKHSNIIGKEVFFDGIFHEFWRKKSHCDGISGDGISDGPGPVKKTLVKIEIVTRPSKFLTDIFWWTDSSSKCILTDDFDGLKSVKINFDQNLTEEAIFYGLLSKFPSKQRCQSFNFKILRKFNYRNIF